MSTQKISVIMPAYNHERYVGEAIESVLNQSYENFEFIIINDGSTDRTPEIINSYKDSRIKYYNQENNDAPSTLNKALSIAKGDYISIINSDDKYHLDRLLVSIETAESANYNFIITDIDFINHKSEIISNTSTNPIPWVNSLKRDYLEIHSLEKTFFYGNLAVTSSNFFLKSTNIDEVGSFNLNRYTHDYDFALRNLAKYRDSFGYIYDKKLLLYRIHKNNTLSESSEKLSIEVCNVLVGMLPEFMSDNHAREILNTNKELYMKIDQTVMSDRSGTPELRKNIIALQSNILNIVYQLIHDEHDKLIVLSTFQRLRLISRLFYIKNIFIRKLYLFVRWVYINMPGSIRRSNLLSWLHDKYEKMLTS